ncbi:AAA ATPase central domain protein [Rhizobium sp. CF080]|nr:AAA ATPase central domain protein [Rhizobium sp. CF080]
MDRLAAFLIRRLQHLNRREVRRLALRNGLLTPKIIEIEGHLVARYAPTFDPSHLTGDAERDVRWIRTRFAAFLTEPPTNRRDHVDPFASAPALPAYLRRGSGVAPADRHVLRDEWLAYAVWLVGEAGAAVSVKHLAPTLLLAGAIREAGVSLRMAVDLLRQPAPIISVEISVDGFERALLQLVEETALVPFGPYVGMTAEFMEGDEIWAWKESEVKRVFLHVLSRDDARLNRPAMRRRLVSALAHGSPVLAIAETEGGVSDQIDIVSDIRLTGRGMDRRLITDLLEVVYGEAVSDHANGISQIDTAALTLGDLGLAIRQGRAIETTIEALTRLAARNRDEENDDERSDGSSTRRIVSQTPSQKTRTDEEASKSAPSKSGTDRKDRSKRKPTGAEVVKPQPLAPEDGGDGKPSLIVETLSGYGGARDWALGLKGDLADYLAGDLDWSEMSTKLLLSGPPGTGKTTFARALCNSLQIPLVVTSVSTWLQGEYLHAVLDRMADTFAEARAQAPCILFIDEIDGIGTRVSASRQYADYWNACVNKLLELLDGAVKSEGVIVVGATNRPHEIDEAIRRSGRLETHIEIPRPDIPALAGIIAHHLGADIGHIAANAEHEGTTS